MKKVFYFIVAAFVALGLASCSKEKKEEGPQKWEYKTLIVYTYSVSDYFNPIIFYPKDRLDELGTEGWELVNVYTTIETAHPNFGDAKYVTGLQPNTRDNSVNYVFKRPVMKGNADTESVETISSGVALGYEEPAEGDQAPAVGEAVAADE